MNAAEPRGLGWKANWPESRRRYEAWWAGTGLVVGAWGFRCRRSPGGGIGAVAGAAGDGG